MTTTDRELLQRAAKAAGHEIARWSDDGESLLLFGVQEPWNPLHDDGDAFRLAVKLDIVPRVINGVAFAWRDGVCDIQEPVSADPIAATRRAIVRAAAAMAGEGENTP